MRPIGEALDELTSMETLPAEALAECLARFDEAAPPLRAFLERAADGAELDDDESTQLFHAVHVLAAGRDALSFGPLLRLLGRSSEEVDELLGDAITETLPRIAAGLFNGDTKALLDLIADRETDEYVRGSLLRAVAFLTFDGRIERDQTIAFLEQFDDERLAEPKEQAWHDWELTIALLGLRPLVPRVERAWRDGRMDLDFSDLETFRDDLARTESAPKDPERFADLDLGYVDDLVETLDWVSYEDSPDEEEETVPAPAINLWRDVGRNDPCPCGSGKKAKKCCMAG